MIDHDKISAAPLIVHNLARGRGQADRDQDQDQGSRPTSLSTNAAEVPSSFPRCEELSSSSGFDSQPSVEQLLDLVRDLQEQNTDLAHDRDLTDRECRKLRREAGQLRKKLEDAREDDPKSKDIREVLDHWVKATGKSSRTSVTPKTPTGGVRWASVQARLNDTFTVDDLKQAVDGAVRMPFVGPRGRQAVHAPGCQREDDIELICRNERNVERFKGYAGPKLKPQLSLVPPTEQGPLERAVSQLAEGRWLDGGYMSECPCCDGDLFVRSLKGAHGVMVLADCYGTPPCDRAEVMLAAGLNAGSLVELAHLPGSWVLPDNVREAMGRLLELDAAHRQAAA